MFYKIKAVTALPAHRLLVQFCAGATKEYDVTPLFKKWPVFVVLRDIPGLFENVNLDAGGYGISWNDDLDLSCNELWDNGKNVSTAFDGLIPFSEATSMWGLNESTLRKAISTKKLVNGIDAQKFGKQWVISETAMRREYGNPKAQ